MRHSTSVFVCIASAGLLLFTEYAQAASGSVSGRLRFTSELGNNCKSSAPEMMNCTGAYIGAGTQFTTQPLINVRVFLVDQAGVDIGIGATDANGDFTIAWTSPSLPTRIDVQRFFADNNLRFWTADAANNSVYALVTSVANPSNGVNVPIGTVTAVFNTYDNVYEGMRMAWENAYKHSAATLAQVWLQKVRTFATPTGSKASGTLNIADADKRRNWVIAHEWGHSIDLILTSVKQCLAYNRRTATGTTSCVNVDPYTSCYDSGQHLQADNADGEHYCASFAEGWANYLATTTLYAFNAPQPMGCVSDSPCVSLFDFEDSIGSFCTDGEQHGEMQVARYIWDTFDTVGDAGWTDSVPAWAGGRFAAIMNTFDTWPAGVGAGQINEPWNGTLTLLLNPDGRSGLDWKALNDPVETTTNQYTNNCSPGN